MGASRIKILLVSGADVYGGCEEHIRTLAKYLDKKTFEVSAAVSCRRLADELASVGIKVFSGVIKGKYDIRAVFRLKRIIEEEGPDIIHTHDRRADLMGGIAARLRRVKAVSTIHVKMNITEKGERSRGISSLVYRTVVRDGFAKIITLSEAVRQNVIREIQCRSGYVIGIRSGLDLERLNFKRDEKNVRRRLGVRTNQKIVGLVARLEKGVVEHKGVRYFMEGASLVLRKFNNAVFLIVGVDEKSEEILKEMARRAGVEMHVRFVRYTRAVLEVMTALDVLVLPSLFEGIPFVLMEGMGLGIPVIGTRVDGIKELIEDGKSGLLVSPKNSEELSIAILKLLNDKALALRLSAAGRKRIFEHFDAGRVASETAAVYAGLMR